MRILMLTQRLPYAPNRGDRLRAYHMLRKLQQHGDVDLVSLVHDDEEAAHATEMRSWVSSVTALPVSRMRSYVNAALALPTRIPLTHAMLDAPGIRSALGAICDQRPPDVVFAYCSSMARFAMEPPLNRIPLVLDFVDVDSAKWRAMAAAGPWPQSWIYQREAATLGAFEARVATRAIAALVVNNREADLARALAPDANIHVIPNGVELERLRPVHPPDSTPRVVFCGVMDYAPNLEGMTWFIREVWPKVCAARPDATLAIVGQRPTEAFKSFCSSDASITVTGHVADVRDWLWGSAVSIAPLHVARGVQNKVLEAIAAGLPVVMTEEVAAGLPPVSASASLVANHPDRFADHVLDLLSRTPEQRRGMARSSDLSSLTWARTLESLPAFFQRARQPLVVSPALEAVDLRIRLPIANR
jgi:polysaccharide biosynthesis protein PslH